MARGSVIGELVEMRSVGWGLVVGGLLLIWFESRWWVVGGSVQDLPVVQRSKVDVRWRTYRWVGGLWSMVGGSVVGCRWSSACRWWVVL